MLLLKLQGLPQGLSVCRYIRRYPGEWMHCDSKQSSALWLLMASHELEILTESNSCILICFKTGGPRENEGPFHTAVSADNIVALVYMVRGDLNGAVPAWWIHVFLDECICNLTEIQQTLKKLYWFVIFLNHLFTSKQWKTSHCRSRCDLYWLWFVWPVETSPLISFCAGFPMPSLIMG